MQQSEKKSFIQELENNPVKVNNSSLLDIKIALDDILVKYFQDELGYIQDHKLEDRNLAVQFLLNLMGGITALYAYNVPFNESKLVIGLICVAYFLLNLTWSAYYYFIAKHYTYIGSLHNNNNIVRIRTEMKPPSTMYTIFVSINNTKESNLKKPVEEWFDVAGTLDPSPFVSDIKAFLGSIEKSQ